MALIGSPNEDNLSWKANLHESMGQGDLPSVSGFFFFFCNVLILCVCECRCVHMEVRSQRKTFLCLNILAFHLVAGSLQ